MGYIKFGIVLLCVASIALNIFLLTKRTNGPEEPESIAKELFQQKSKQYPLLSRRILNEYDHDVLIHFTPLRSKLREVVEKKYGSDFTLYFEYLPTEISIGVNEKTEFYASSLFKVPTIMAYYHDKEANNLKDDPVVTIEEKHLDNHFGTLFKKGAGSKVSLDEAVNLALTQSDNTAINLIIDHVGQEDYRYILQGLDLTIREGKDKQAIFTAKSYSSVLKALFFSSLLSKDNSGYILDLLTKTEFSDKLPAGVPKEVPVAHKIGVWEKDEMPIYTDCGIVYVPRRPYLLCMASRGDESLAQTRMKDISKMIYDFVETNESTSHMLK